MSTSTSHGTAIVTGASHGFGRSIAGALVRHGVDVVGVARDADALGELRSQLGPAFTPFPADVTDDGLAPRLLTDFRPSLLVLNAGATPRAATIQDQSWESFSENWFVDVRQCFSFARAALVAPLDAGSTVISLSSGAALNGSPMSGGYAGAKATIKFISSYAGVESNRNGLGIRFVALLPKLTPATRLGTTFVDTYADYEGIDRAAYRERLGTPLGADQVGDAVVGIATDDGRSAAAYLLTADGLSELP